MRAESRGSRAGIVRRWLQVIAAAGATLLCLFLVFSVVAIGTTSLPIRLVVGIGAPGVAAVFFGGSKIAKGDRRRGAGIWIGLAVATPITLFLWWVMLFSSGDL